MILNNIDSVAVLLAAYNSERWLVEQIETILNQEFVDIHLHVSIDTSTDNTVSVCDHLKQKYPKITILQDKGKFGSAASNFFRLIRDVNFTDYNYISFSDQDDIWHSSKLSRAVAMLNKYNCDGYSSNVIAFWPDGREKLIDKAQPQVEWDYLFESAGPGCTFVLTKKFALELQSFVRANKEAITSVWMHDWFIYAFARSRGFRWFIDEKPSMLYRQHENNQIGVNAGYRAFIHRTCFVLGSKALKQSSLIASLCGLDNHPFVKRWNDHSRLGMLYLAFNATKCRRKRSEQFIFAISCLVLFIVVGHKKL